jgi:hypothetical protein
MFGAEGRAMIWVGVRMEDLVWEIRSRIEGGDGGAPEADAGVGEPGVDLAGGGYLFFVWLLFWSGPCPCPDGLEGLARGGERGGERGTKDSAHGTRASVFHPAASFRTPPR